MDDRTKLLVASVHKLYTRGAKPNIRKILAKTHPSDIAAVLQSLDSAERYDIFTMEPSAARRAGILSYLDEGRQKEIVGLCSQEEVLRMLSHMDTDDAADLLGILPEEDSKEFLSAMVRKDSEEVAGLMGFPDDSAGGLMSSDFLAVNQNLNVAQAVEAIQAEGDSGKISFYLYVVNDHGQLVGVVSLKQLLLSKKEELLKTLMYKDVVSVKVDTHQEEVASTVERYDYLALPVIDGNNSLVGVITVDDVIDVIREEAEEDFLAMGRAGGGFEESIWDHFKARIPWVLLSFLGGSICFLIIFSNRPVDGVVSHLWYLAALLPLLLSVGATTGSQSATVAVGLVRSGKFEFGNIRSHLFQEISVGLLMGFFVGLVVFICASMWTHETFLAIYFGAATFFAIAWSVSIGSGIPLILHKLKMDPTVASVPLFTVLADISSVLLLFFIYQLL